VLACPPSTLYKLRKFARKNKGFLRAAAAFVLLLAAGSVVSTWQAIRATQAEAKEAERADAERKARLEEKVAKERESEALAATKKALNDIEAQRSRAEANFAKALAVVDDYLTKVSESQLLKVPGMQPLRRELLASALKFYDGFSRSGPAIRLFERSWPPRITGLAGFSLISARTRKGKWPSNKRWPCWNSLSRTTPKISATRPTWSEATPSPPSTWGATIGRRSRGRSRWARNWWRPIRSMFGFVATWRGRTTCLPVGLQTVAMTNSKLIEKL